MESIFDYYDRIDERRRIAEGTSELLLYCLDLLDASLWSLAGGEDPQALVQLDGCMEIAFKAELETIHRVLIADPKRLDYDHLKQLLRESFATHPRGSRLNISDFGIEHTITFSEAKRRVRELLSAVKKCDTQIDQLHEARNDIVHYGPNRNKAGEYAAIIATIGFPVLADLLLETGSVVLEQLLTPPVWRELGVARAVCDHCTRARVPVGPYCLKTVRWRVLHDRVQWPHPDDDAESVEVDWREHEMADRVRHEVERRWDLVVEHECRICGWYPSFIAVEAQTEPLRKLVPLAFQCPKCGLTIAEEDRFLAELHLDNITHEQTETLLKDIGE